jgi:REP element-mobilizing transposase RayT
MAHPPESRLPVRRTGDLRLGRVSIPGATYFLTLCELKRRPNLSSPSLAPELKAALDQTHASGDFTLIAATVMPDHVHLLGKLGRRLSLSRTVGKFKHMTRAALAHCSLAWQENFYDHRLRTTQEVEPFVRYVFLNPYRAGLIGLRETWPWWWRWGEVRFEFEEMVRQHDGVPAEWMAEKPPDGTEDE